VKPFLFALLCLVGGAAAAEPVSDAANRYLDLVLAVDQHDPVRSKTRPHIIPRR